MFATDICCLEQHAKELCAIYCREPVSAQALADWFGKVDFEALPPEVTCMAAAAGTLCRFSGVPEKEIPRLRGIVRYVHTLNSGMMSGICVMAGAMNKAGIDVLLLEETGLYLCCPEAPQRHLWQTRIGVRRQDLQKAARIIRDAGFTVDEYPTGAVARQGVTRQTAILALSENAFVWENARPWQRSGVNFLCPELAVAFVSIQQSAFRGLTGPAPRATILRWVMDMKQLLARMEEKDWVRALQIAKQEHACAHIRLLLEIYQELSGDANIGKYAARFGTAGSIKHIPGMIRLLRSLPEKGTRVRRAWLLCRLRRPDSLLRSGILFGKMVLKKIAQP